MSYIEPQSLYVGIPSVSLSYTLTKNEKVEHYIRIKTYKLIVLRFWVKSCVNPLCVLERKIVGNPNVSLNLTLTKNEKVGNPNMSLGLTLSKNEKVEHYIRIKTHNTLYV